MNTDSLANHGRQATDQQVTGLLHRTYAATPKLRTVDPNADEETIARVKHVMRPKEKLMQFFVRTGLGKAQIASMSRSEISHFVEQAERNRLQEQAPEMFEPKRPPLRFLLDLLE